MKSVSNTSEDTRKTQKLLTEIENYLITDANFQGSSLENACRRSLALPERSIDYTVYFWPPHTNYAEFQHPFHEKLIRMDRNLLGVFDFSFE